MSNRSFVVTDEHGIATLSKPARPDAIVLAAPDDGYQVILALFYTKPFH
ncbi:MAG: hypothetical protein QM736_03990 [Vicinamibacterales bacterium]